MDQDAAFVGAIPELYEEMLGPVLFEPFAQDLAGRLAGFEGRILETAAGTGRLTRALLAAAPRAQVVATDLNPPMLAKAGSLTSDPRVSWQTANAEALPFEAGSFDAVVCQFGVMFFPDRVRAYRETLRVLTPGAPFLFNVWDRLESNPLSAVVHAAVVAEFPDNPPSFFGRVPHGYADGQRIEAELREAGFGQVSIERVSYPTAAPSALEAAQGLCLGTPLRSEIEARAPERLEPVVQRVAGAIEEAFGRGPLSPPGSALVVSTQRPEPATASFTA